MGIAGLAASGGGTAAAAITSTTTTPAVPTVTEIHTVTEPVRTDTVVVTNTVTAPAVTTPVLNHTTSVSVTPATTTESGQSGSSGLPGWGWLLIGAGAVGVGVLIFHL